MDFKSIFRVPSMVIPNVITVDDIVSNNVVNGNTALQIASFYQGISAIANTISSMPLKIFQNKTIAKDHPVFYLLKEKPNPFQTAFEFINTMILIMLVKGNSFAKIIRDNQGNPKELRIIVFTSVQAVFYGDKLYFKFDGQKNNLIANEDLIHFKNIGTGYLGIDPVTNFKRNLEINLNGIDYTNNIYNGEGGSIRGTIHYDKPLNDKQREFLRGELTNNFSGRKGKRILFLEDGMKLNPIQLDPSQTKFLESRQFEKEEIASMLNLPLFILNGNANETNQNIEFNNIRFYQMTLLPIITKIESEFKHKLLTKDEILSDNYIRFSIEGILRGDSKTRGQFYKDLFYLGAISPEEIRDLEDMNPEVKGESFIQANLIPKNIVNRFWDSKARETYSKAELNENELNNLE
ncbi:phage portal protein [Algoriphagus sp. AK58]|uniref:phage portal protein n=1 Tax=Algoriphagus sp. AK58 TaxID=1406877 RepID=UPI0016500487|nr:phage portal protein [Algoriphagus sp. AK58]MBC6365790.1 phage portal protein [Algoriphagus sp. AK58]